MSQLPEPPYYAVIFSSKRSQVDEGYANISAAMLELALKQPGCLGAESARGADGFGITVSYWQDEESIRNWKQNARHLMVQKLGKEKWYDAYEVKIAQVTRAYSKTEGS